MPAIRSRIERNKGQSLLIIPESYVVIDIETTGFCSKYDEIIELSAIKVVNNQVVDKFSTLVKPDNKIDDFIIDLTGITNEMLSNAPKIQQALPEYINFLGDNILIGHNVNFDVNFIYDNLNIFFNKEFNNDFVDTIRFSRRLLQELENHKLKTIARHFELKFDKMHRGLIDCEITYQILLKFKEIILAKYGDCNNFYAEQIKVQSRARNITSQKTVFNEDHPLFNKLCVFTGTLSKMTRNQAMQAVVDFGGLCSENLNQATNFLIVGEQDYSRLNGKVKSNKMIKAEKYILQGQDIMILSENAFYDLIFTRFD